MKTLAAVIVSLIAINSKASEWFCENQASERHGDTITACGIASAVSEQDARNKAFDAAKIEFDKICNSDTSCKHHEIGVVPKRTECQVTESSENVKLIRCVRAVQFSIGESNVPAKKAVASGDSGDFIIKKGMTKAEVVEILGEPDEVLDSGQWYYGDRPYCKGNAIGKSCGIVFEHGKIDRYYDFTANHIDIMAD